MQNFDFVKLPIINRLILSQYYKYYMSKKTQIFYPPEPKILKPHYDEIFDLQILTYLGAQQSEMTQKMYTKENFKLVASEIQSTNKLVQHKGMVMMRKMMGLACVRVEASQYIEKFLIPKCLEFMKKKSFWELRYEGCYTLAILVTDRALRELLVKKYNCIEELINLFDEERYIQIQNKASQALRTIFTDYQLRCWIDENDIIGHMIQKLKKTTKKTQSKQIIRILYSICQERKYKFRYSKQIGPILCQVLKSDLLLKDSEEDLIIGVLEGLERLIYIYKGSMNQYVVGCGVLEVLLDFGVGGMEVGVWALMVLCCFTTVKNGISELARSDKFWHAALFITTYSCQQSCKILCLILTAIINENQEHTNTLLSKPKLLKNLTKLLTTGDYQTCYQVCQLYQCLIIDPPQPNKIIQLILSQNILEAVLKLFESQNIKRVQGAQIMLRNMLDFGKMNSINTGQDLFMERLTTLDTAQLQTGLALNQFMRCLI